MVREEKIKAVEELKKMIESYPVIGIVDLFKLKTAPLQEIKKGIESFATLKVVRKSILLHALKSSSKENIKKLEEFIPLQPAVLFSNLDCFKLYGEIKKIRPKVFAKEGDIAEEDIMVKAGPTQLLPGPVISEFAKVKIPIGTEGGKIVIRKDTVVAKKGDKISKDLAAVLRKLQIKPVSVSLKIVAFFDNGKIYSSEVLSLVGEGYLNLIKECFRKALNVSIAIGYPTKENIGYLLSKAYQEAKLLENKIIGGVK
jgi:large subunit ribosomal protein L10